MDHQKLVDSAKKFIDVSSYREAPTPAKPFVEPRALIESRIDGAVSHLDKMFGYSLVESDVGGISSDVNKELSKFYQGSASSASGEVVYTCFTSDFFLISSKLQLLSFLKKSNVFSSIKPFSSSNFTV